MRIGIRKFTLVTYSQALIVPKSASELKNESPVPLRLLCARRGTSTNKIVGGDTRSLLSLHACLLCARACDCSPLGLTYTHEYACTYEYEYKRRSLSLLRAPFISQFVALTPRLFSPLFTSPSLPISSPVPVPQLPPISESSSSARVFAIFAGYEPCNGFWVLKQRDSQRPPDLLCE